MSAATLPAEAGCSFSTPRGYRLAVQVIQPTHRHANSSTARGLSGSATAGVGASGRRRARATYADAVPQVDVTQEPEGGYPDGRVA